MTGRRACAALLLIVSALGPAQVLAQATPEPISWRRVFASVDDLAAWPRGDERYVPIEPDEFEKLIRAPGAAPPARLESVQFTATLTPEYDLAGAAELTIASPQAGAVSLTPCKLAIANPRWLSPERTEVVVGQNAQQVLTVLAPGAGVLAFDWSLRATRRSSKALEFEFSAPAAPISRLMLDLPEYMTLQASRGVVLESKLGASGRRLWPLELGGVASTRLTLTSVGPSAGETIATARSTHAYECTPRGLDLTAKFVLDAPRDGVKAIDVALDPALQIVTARLNDRRLNWIDLQKDPKAGDVVRLILEQPLSRSAPVLEIAAVAPVPFGRVWKLPVIQLRNVDWREGTASLLTPSPFAVERLEFEHARQTRVSTLPSPLLGEVIDLQWFAPNPEVAVVIGRASMRVQAKVGVTSRFEADRISSEMVAELQLQQGARLSLEAVVAAQWTIDSIESSPSGAVADWSVVRDNETQRLVVRLLRPLSSNSPLRLIGNAHAVGDPSLKPLAPSDLIPLVWTGARDEELLFAMSAPPQYELEWKGGASNRRLDPQAIPVSLRELVSGGDTALFVNMGDGAWNVNVRPRRPEYSGSLRTEVSLEASRINERYRFECAPGEAGLQHVAVQFSNSRSTSLEWSVEGLENSQWSATRRESAAAAPANEMEPESWDIAFLKPRLAPVSITATRTSEWTRTIPLSLPILTDATSQSAVVLVRAAGNVLFDLERQGLSSRLVEEFDEKLNDLRAVFHYQSSRNAPPAVSGTVSVAPTVAETTPYALWAWNCHLRSTFEATGRTVHRLTYRVQGAGRVQGEIRPPIGTEWDEARIDGIPAARTPTGAVKFTLPQTRRFAVIDVAYTVNDSAFRRYARRSPVLPTTDFPVLVTQWTYSAPPGFSYVTTEMDDAHAWRRRFFGPLARPADNAIEPGGTGLMAIFANPSNAAAEDRVRAETFLGSLGEAMKYERRRSLSEATWESLLKRALSSDISEPLWIDADRLAEAGVFADRSLHLAQIADDGTEGALRLLAQSNLAIVVTGDLLVLTSQEWAASDRKSRVSLDGGAPLWRVGNLGEPMAFTDALVTVEHWSAAPGAVWGKRSRSAPVPAGWVTGRRAIVSSTKTTIVLVNETTVTAIPFLMAISVLAAAGILRWNKPAHGALLLAVAIAATIAAPAAFSPVAAGLFWGAAIWFLKTLIPREWGATKEANSSVAVQREAVVLLLLAAVSIPGAAALADTPPAPATAFKVFIPTGADGKPTGARYLAPEALISAVRRASKPQAADAWLLRSANYEGTIGGTEKSPSVSSFVATFEIESLTPDARMILPLNPGAAGLVPEEMQLDSQLPEFNWVRDETALEVNLPHPGRHLLRVPLHPATRESGDRASVSLEIPAVSNSSLRISSAGANEIEVSEALGAVVMRAPQVVEATLGPVERLSFSWRTSATFPTAVDPPELHEYAWLKIHPGSVAVEMQFHAVSGKHPIDRLVVQADSNLRLLPQSQPGLEVNNLGVLQNDPTRTNWEFRFSRDAGPRRLFQCAFSVTGASGVGRIGLPEVSTPEAKVTRRWLAVSVDPALKHEVDSAQPPIDVAEFMKEWGPSPAPPLIARQLDKTSPSPVISTRPSPLVRSATQLLSIVSGPRSATFTFTSTVNVENGYAFQHHVLAPKEIEIEQIGVSEQGLERPVRWARDPAGRVSIFLGAPSSAAQEITLRGSIPLATDKSFRAPRIVVEDASIKQFEIDVLRQSDVLVRVISSEHLKPSSDPPSEASIPDGRRVASFTAETDDYSLVLAVRRNAPKVTGSQTMLVRGAGVKWDAEAQLDLDVKDGLLDELRFDLPPQWTGPFTLSPAIPFEVIETSAEARRDLVVRLDVPVSGRFSLKIAGAVELSEGNAPTAPWPRSQFDDALRRLLVLPTVVNTQTIAWRGSGVVPVAAPPNLARRIAKTDRTFRVLDPAHTPVILIVDKPAQGAKAVLCDVRIHLPPDGSFSGMAEFQFESPPRDECVLSLPQDCELIQVMLNASPALISPASEGRWRIRMNDRRLPCSLSVIFRAPPSASRNVSQLNLQPPLLEGVQVLQTLWSINGDNLQDRWTAPGVTLLSSADANRFRAGAIGRLLDRPPIALDPSRAEPESNWKRTWETRFERLLQSIQDAAVFSPDSELSDAGPPLVELEDQFERMRAQDGAGGPRVEQRTLDFSGAVAPLLARGDRVEFTTTASAPLLLTPDRAANSMVFARAILALAAVAIGVLLARRWREREEVEILLQWPRAFAVLIGISWWLFATPAILGLLLIAAAFLSSVGMGWRAPAPAAYRGVAR